MRTLTFLLLIIFSLVAAGNLDPPIGPPAPTMKTLDEVEPRTAIGPDTTPGDTDYEYVISNPGSYYLTGNVTTSKCGINITSHNVTLDLCGFSLIGPGSGFGIRNFGIYLGDIGVGEMGLRNVEIRNGIIRNFGDFGIYTGFNGHRNHRLINLRVLSNGTDAASLGGGIRLRGNSHLIKGCTVNLNGTSSTVYVYGIYTEEGCIVTGNTVCKNGDTASDRVWGILTSSGCVVTGNSVSENGNSSTGPYVYGISTGEGCTVTGNTVCKNGESAEGTVWGMNLSSGCVITGNSASENGNSSTGSAVYGIAADYTCEMTDNTAHNNGVSASGTVYGIHLTGESPPKTKTLDEVEPRIAIGPDTTPGDTDYEYVISNAGSYYLTGNVTTSKSGINITSHNVTLDLCGFSLIGPGSGFGIRNYGIYLGDLGVGEIGLRNVEIRNGIIRNFGDFGIYTGFNGHRNHRLINLRVLSNGIDAAFSGGGIRLRGNSHLIKDCTANHNSTSSAVYVYGIYTEENCIVTGNTVCKNGDTASDRVWGILTSSGCVITGNSVSENGNSSTGPYVYGISTGEGCTVTGNTACNNGVSAASATVSGIDLSGYNVVDQNTAYNNGTGAGSAINMDTTIATCVYGNNVAP